MQPLSINTRRFYFYTLIAIFCVVVPTLVLYALGYRFDQKLGLVPTGGLYIGTDISGASISLDGEPIRETGTFRKAFLIQDLLPNTVKVKVEKEGYFSWEKELQIDAHVVTEAYAFLFPQEPELREILPMQDRQPIPNATSTGPLLTEPNPEFAPIVVLFGEVATTTATTTRIIDKKMIPQQNPPVPTAIESALSSLALLEEEATTTVEQRGIALVKDGDGVTARWLRGGNEAPYYFCSVHGSCIDQIEIDSRGTKVIHFDFFPGRNDVVLLAREDGIYATEIDSRGGQNSYPLYRVVGSDFRLGPRGEIYVRNGNRFFEVIL